MSYVGARTKPFTVAPPDRRAVAPRASAQAELVARPRELARDGVDDGLLAVLGGEDVPRVGLDLEVPADVVVPEAPQQRHEEGRRVLERPEALAKNGHVEVDAPFVAGRVVGARGLGEGLR